VYPYFFVCGGGGWDSFKVVVAMANRFVLLRQLYSRIASIWWLFGWLVVLCGGGLLLTTLWFVVVAVCWLLFGQLVWWVGGLLVADSLKGSYCC
jgi:hypothetical protein